MGSRDGHAMRFFKKFLAEVRSVTTPEIILGVLLAVAAFLFKYFLGGGLSWKDVSSIVIPSTWVGCALGCMYTLKAGYHLRLEDVAAWKGWAPLLHGNFSRPKKPSILPVSIVALALLGFFVGVFVLTFAVEPRIATVASDRQPGQANTAHLPAPPPPREKNSAQPSRRQRVLKFIFKSSPALTNERKELIAEQMNLMYDYLVRLGFDAPKEVPPIGTTKDPDFTAMFNRPGPIYWNGFSIPEAWLDDPLRVQRVYMFYAFDSLLGVHTKTGPDSSHRIWASGILANYFLSNFSEKHRKAGGKWNDALWEIRRVCGGDFTNRSLFFAIKSFDDPGDKKPEEGFDKYFVQRFLSGEFVVDNNLSNLPAILKILRENGLLVDKQ